VGACGLLLAGSARAYADAPAQMFEGFTDGSTRGFGGGTGGYFNPATGGVDGVGDGFLMISSSFDNRFAAADFGGLFTGPNVDYLASGVTGLEFWLNDVGQPDPFEIHVGFGVTPQAGASNIWFTRAGFQPVAGQWTRFTVDFTDPSQWIRTHGSAGTFEDALSHVTRLVFRHDVDPIVQSPDPISGDLGIDSIRLLPEPASALILLVGVGAICGFGKRRRNRIPAHRV